MTSSNTILNRLDRFLDKMEPRLIRLLTRVRDAAINTITYKELRDALLSGILSEELLEKWRGSYASMVVEQLVPSYREAIRTAKQGIVTDLKSVLTASTVPEVGTLDYAWLGAEQWINERGANLVRLIGDDQVKSIRYLTGQSVLLGQTTVDDMAQLVRPLVGLTSPESAAVERFYQTRLANGAGPKRALRDSKAYADRLHRGRAHRIARTEMVSAFNAGNEYAVTQARAEGLIVDWSKRWSTSRDERVCPTCGPLHDVTIGREELFAGKYQLPPAHPQCRCAVAYELTPALVPVVAKKGNPYHDELGRFTFGPGGDSEWYASRDEWAETVAQVQAKIQAAPVPSRAEVEKARKELAEVKEKGGRHGGDARGSAPARRKRRENLFKEFGGERRGYVICHSDGCGKKMHWTDDLELNPLKLPKFEQGKIFVRRQGGGYRLHNLLPECADCNRSRGDDPIRPENLD